VGELAPDHPGSGFHVVTNQVHDNGTREMGTAAIIPIEAEGSHSACVKKRLLFSIEERDDNAA